MNNQALEGRDPIFDGEKEARGKENEVINRRIHEAYDWAVRDGRITDDMDRETSIKVQAEYIRKGLEVRRQAAQKAAQSGGTTSVPLSVKKEERPIIPKVQQKAINPFAGLKGEALYKAEFASSKEIQREFERLEYYSAFRQAEDEGRLEALVRRGRGVWDEQPQKETLVFDEGKFRSEYAKTEALQHEFGSVEAYVGYRKAESEGRVKIAGRKVVKQ